MVTTDGRCTTSQRTARSCFRRAGPRTDLAADVGRGEKAHGVALTNCRKGDEAAGEPDVVCQLGSERRGIEVVDCWYSGDDAKTVWGLVADLLGRSARRICQRALVGPHGVRRHGLPSWLILNASQAPLHSSGEGPYLVSWLKKPGTWRYTDAYLCLAQTSTWGRHFFRVP